jgi:hypothetical protein
MSVDHRNQSAGPTDPASWVGRSLVWRDGHVLATDVGPTALLELLGGDERARAWWCLPREEGPALTDAAESLGLDALAVEDILGSRESPKLDTIGDTVMIIGAGVQFDPDGATLDIAGCRSWPPSGCWLLVADEQMLSMLAPVLQQCAPRVMTEGVAGGIHGLLDDLVDAYSDALEAMEEATETLTESLFADRPLAREDQLRGPSGYERRWCGCGRSARPFRRSPASWPTRRCAPPSSRPIRSTCSWPTPPPDCSGATTGSDATFDAALVRRHPRTLSPTFWNSLRSE